MTTPRIYRLKLPELPWGDYGDVLAHGFAELSEDRSTLDLQRTGPFIPPLSQPLYSNVVVTAECLSRLQASGLTGYSVIPVVVIKSPKIDWRSWIPYGDQEMKYPAGNEPENYISRRKHSPEASAGFGDLSALLFQPGIDFVYGKEAHVAASSWNQSDFFVDRSERPIYQYVSERARDWLTREAGEWVAFEEERVR